MSINFSELQALLGAIAQAEITELSLETEEFKLRVKKEGSGVMAPTPAALPLPSTTAAPTAPPELSPISEPEPAPPSPADQKWTAITSPMVGTFYRAPAPEEPPFVEVGDAVRKEQVVCIIEAMKLMNEIESEIAGQVMEIAVTNGEPVEYGQTLMWVKVG